MVGQARLVQDAIAMLPKQEVSARLFSLVDRHFIVHDGNDEALSKEMMFRLSIAISLIVTFGTLTPSIANSVENTPIFFAGIEDLPLAPGLHEIPEESLIYDTSAGRIVQAYAQLGWQVLGKTLFRREAETLEFKLSKTTGGVRLVVRLTPVEP
jgi:hypothetical protein